MKRRLGILLALVLCTCVLCMSALADGNGTITVGGNYTNGIVFDANTAYAITNRNGEVQTDGASEDNYNTHQRAALRLYLKAKTTLCPDIIVASMSMVK